jgi:ubiquinone/menaquinone biosynthesis C-methylase UbiE
VTNHNQTDSSSKQWTDYWADGHLHSLSAAFEANYAGTLADFWHNAFSALPEQARLLDIGTGNGAIPLLAIDYLKQQKVELNHWDITGIDLAQVSNQHIDASYNIKLMGGVSATDTPFDEPFDLITAKYALEYMPRAAALAEIKRLLKPGASFAAILHHEKSAIATFCQQELEQIKLLADSKIFISVRNLIKAMGNFKPSDPSTHKPNAKADRLRASFNQAAGFIQQQQQKFLNPAFMMGCLGTLAQLFEQLDNLNLKQRLEHIEQCRLRVKSNSLRLKDFADALLTEQAFNELCEQFKALGFEITKADEISHQGDLLGWQLVATNLPKS